MRHFWLVDRANDRPENSFFFLFLFFPLFLLSSCLFLLLFFRHLSILRRPSKVRSRRTRGLEYLEEQRIGISSFRSLRRVASFDSLIQYRFSIVSQRISLEDRRIRNSLFSRRGKIRPSVFSFSATISNVTPSTLSLQPCLQTIASLPAELSGSEGTDLLIYQRIPRHFHLERSVQCRLLFREFPSQTQDKLFVVVLNYNISMKRISRIKRVKSKLFWLSYLMIKIINKFKK